MEIISKKWQMILLGSLLISALFFAVSIFITPKYQAQVDILVVPQVSSLQEDISGTALYLSQVLADSVHSTSFVEKINKYAVEIKNNPKQAINDWQGQVNVKKEKDSAVIEIKVYDTSAVGAFNLSEEISNKLIELAPKYIGQTDKIKLEIVSGPMFFTSPAKPNIILNVVVGFLIGLVVAFLFVQLFEIEFQLKKASSIANLAERNKSFGSRTEKEVDDLGFDQEVYPIGKMMRRTKADLASFSKKSTKKDDSASGQQYRKKNEEPIESVRMIQPNGSVEPTSAQRKIKPFIEDKKEPVRNLGPEESLAGLERLPFIDSEEDLPWNKPKENVQTAEKNEESVIEQKSDGFMPLEALGIKQKEGEATPEPTEEEIKDRLNKLLRGEF